MLDRWVIGSIVLLVLVCFLSAWVAVAAWLPDRQERARIRAERVERILRDEHDLDVSATESTVR
jgi:hypothetical protein